MYESYLSIGSCDIKCFTSVEEQDKSSDRATATLGRPQTKQYTGGGGTKPTGTSFIFDKVLSGAPDGHSENNSSLGC